MKCLALCICREIYAIGMDPISVYGESAVYQYKIEQDMWVVKNLQECFLGKQFTDITKLHLEGRCPGRCIF